jgi:microcystin-dependent protein
MYGGSAAPGGWLICDGSSVSRNQYSALFAIISTFYGSVDSSSFNLPDLRGKFALGKTAAANLGDTGGEAAHALTVAELAIHAHTIADVQHNHPDPGHNHGLPQSPHGHTGHDTGHAHNYVYPIGNFAAAPGSGQYSAAGTHATELGYAQIVIDAANANISIQASGANLQAAYSGINGTQNAGSGAAHNNMPPYVTTNYIIKT